MEVCWSCLSDVNRILTQAQADPVSSTPAIGDEEDLEDTSAALLGGSDGDYHPLLTWSRHAIRRSENGTC